MTNAEKIELTEEQKEVIDKKVEKEVEKRLEEERCDSKHLEGVIRHISNVQTACQMLGGRLIENGEPQFGRDLIASGMIHDNSKFNGIEWEYLRVGYDKDKELKPMFILALKQHVTTNRHHPEAWDNINDMSRIYVAEMVCDLYSRSSEMGTDFNKFIKEVFLPKYSLSTGTKVYKNIKCFSETLLEKPFSKF